MPDECAAIMQRKALTTAIHRACIPAPVTGTVGNGGEEDMLNAMSILQGIVNEYRDGGDQMLEECTCNSPEEHHVKYSGF